MEEKTIKSVSPVSLGLMMGAISGIIVFIVAILLAVFYLPIIASVQSYNPVPTTPAIDITGFLAAIGILMVIILPIFGFIAGFIQGLLYAVIYNFLAPRIGGIKLRFEETSQTTQ
jgi:hypothetical protein